MPPERRRLLVGLALLLALGVTAWRSYLGSGGTGSAGAPGGAGSARQPAQTAAATEPLPPAEEVRLAALQEQRGEPNGATRNPFKFDRRSAAPTRPDEEPPSSTPAAPAAPPAPSGPPPPPPIPLKFIGVVEKGEGFKWAVLSVGDGRGPLHGKEGDIIDGRYRILKIGTESIDMAYLDGRGRQTIRLTGQ
jgi:hypothetical protein